MLTDSKVKRFWRYVKTHLERMNLNEWTVKTFVKDTASGQEDVGYDEVKLAEVASNPKHMVAAMTLFRDWGENPIVAPNIESTAAHECLHILLSKLMLLAGDRHARDVDLQEEEHIVIRRLLAWKGLS